MDIIIQKLIKNIRNTNKNKSSYWKEYLPRLSNYEDKFQHLNFAHILIKY